MASVRDIPEELSNLMDQIVGLLSEEEIEHKFREVIKEQEEGNKIYGTNIQPREGLMVSAVIQLAKERGVITPEEEKKLLYRIASLA